MSRIVIERADRTHDAELKRILRENTPEGMIRVRYEREPDFMAGTVVEGTHLNVSLARYQDQNQLVGMAVRALKNSYINGEVQPMGYLSSFRIDQAHRGSFTFIKFMRGLKKVHAASACKWDLMMLTDGNGSAERLLLSGRAGLPKAYALGDYHTHLIGLRRAYPLPDSPGFEVRRLREEELDQWFAFLNRAGSQNRELFPAYRPEHLDPVAGLLKGLQPAHVYVALDGEEIIGTLSAWDQNAFKQYYIDGYGGSLMVLRPAINAVAWATGRPLLPRVGAKLLAVFLGTVCIQRDRRDVFDALLRTLLQALRGSNYHALMAGFHARDPLLPVVKTYPHVAYQSQAWLFSWAKVDELVQHLRSAPLYLELGAL
jgi:hypothetical protein